MTMQNAPHPDDELLAAYAGGDRDALADASLVAHLASCDRCRPLVDELSILRGALAELPDLLPSRPLRLIPPLPAPAATSRRGSWLRRLTAPAMAVGAVLVLVGAVGIGVSGSGGAMSGVRDLFRNPGENLQGAAGASEKAVASDNAHLPAPGSAATPLPTSGQARGAEPSSMRLTPLISPTPTPEGNFASEHSNRGSTSEQPWLTLLIAGASLFVISAALRFSVSPRAG
jgi:hypothetical protein